MSRPRKDAQFPTTGDWSKADSAPRLTVDRMNDEGVILLMTELTKQAKADFKCAYVNLLKALSQGIDFRIRQASDKYEQEQRFFRHRMFRAFCPLETEELVHMLEAEADREMAMRLSGEWKRYRNKKKQERLENHQCVTCGKKLPLDYYFVSCRECAAKSYASCRRRNENLKAEREAYYAGHKQL